MSLPKIQYPVNAIKVPSLKKSFKFRPFLVKEEKLLLMAKESSNPSDILQAILQVVNNCSVDEKFRVEDIAIFDLEYLFLKLRAMSVDNIAKVAFRDEEDQKVYDFEVDLNNVDVEFPSNLVNKIEITKTAGIVLRYPPAELYEDKAFQEAAEKDYILELVIRCIDKIYTGDEVFEGKEYKPEELREFLENLDVKTFDKIREYLLNLPKIYHKIEYENSLGTHRVIELTSLNDFFTLR